MRMVEYRRPRPRKVCHGEDEELNIIERPTSFNRVQSCHRGRRPPVTQSGRRDYYQRIGHMKFDPNRCGSFSASADTRGDTTSAKLIDPEPAKTPGDTPAGHIIPAYVKSDPAALVGFVRQHMSFLKATTSLNRMIQAIEKPQNKLFDRLYPEILNIEDASYICLSNDVFTQGKSQEQIESAIDRQMAPSQLQERFPYFTNPLRLCEKRGGRYIGPPPLERIVNRGHVVLTFEYDPDRNERDFLDQ